jgi:DNA-directed RNA polymerase beta' subunit
LVLSLYDLHVNDDLTVRDAYNRIVQFVYGGDGVAVHKSINGKLNVDLLAQILKPYVENNKDGTTGKNKKGSRKNRR